MAKTVLITGASAGIGKVAAAYFQDKGWNVAATMRRPEKEEELNQLDNVKCIYLDVLQQESIEQAIASTLEAFGAIDVIVNNAGIGTVGPFEATSPDQVKKQFDTNLFGLMNVTRSILPYFRSRKGGTIINVASAGGRMTWPLYSLYHGSKWAVEGFSEGLQFEVRQFGIRIKVIEPGSIRTDFFGRSQDFAEKPGLTDYDPYVNRVMPNLQKSGANAPGPEVVAPIIFKAATDQSWQLRYQAGRAAGLTMFLRKIIPLRLFNGIVRMVVERKEDRLRPYREE